MFYPAFIHNDENSPLKVPVIVYSDTTLGDVSQEQVASLIVGMAHGLNERYGKQKPKDLARILMFVWRDDDSVVMFDLHLHYGSNADDPKHPYGPQIDLWTVDVLGDRVSGKGLACGATLIVAGVEERHRRSNWPQDYLEKRPEIPATPHNPMIVEWPK